MKTFNDITHLNYNSLAFFKGIKTTDAKVIISMTLDIKEDEKGKYKVGKDDIIKASDVDFTIKSASKKLEGVNQMKYLCDLCNKEIPLSLLREFAENKSFIKALKFTGKYDIVNSILNSRQVRKLEEIWLVRNIQYTPKSRWSKKTLEFIEANKWAETFIDNYLNN